MYLIEPNIFHHFIGTHSRQIFEIDACDYILLRKIIFNRNDHATRKKDIWNNLITRAVDSYFSCSNYMHWLLLSNLEAKISVSIRCQGWVSLPAVYLILIFNILDSYTVLFFIMWFFFSCRSLWATASYSCRVMYLDSWRIKIKKLFLWIMNIIWMNLMNRIDLN